MWVWDDAQSTIAESHTLNLVQVVCPYSWVTICAKLFTIATWMVDPNYHLPSSSHRGWLLVMG